jgi:hypothetical protein
MLREFRQPLARIMLGLFAAVGIGSPLLPPTPAAAQSGPAPTVGREFLVAFSRFATEDTVGETWDEQQLYLMITAESPATGLIDFTDPAFTDIPFTTGIGNEALVQLPGTDDQPHPAAAPAGISNSSIRITSDVDISVHAMSYAIDSSDAMLVPPLSTGGTMFMVPSYASPQKYAENKTNHAGFIVVAHEDNTQVHYLPRESELTPGDVSLAQELTIFDAPDYSTIETITLDAGEVFRYALANNDPSGSIIETDKPVTVYGYSNCADVPYGSSPCDHLLEAVIPVSAWGVEYSVPSSPERSYSDTFRVYAWEDNTVLTTSGGSQFVTLNAGEFAEYRQQLNTALVIYGTKPFMMVRYISSSGWDSFPLADASMLTMMPTEAGLTSVRFILPSIADTSYTQVVTVVAPRGTDVTLDVNQTLLSDWTPIAGTEYDYTHVQLSAGVDGLSADVPFLAYGWGVRVAESYAFPIGLDLSARWEPQSLLAPHMQDDDSDAAPRVCALIPDMAISPERIAFDAAGRAELTVTLRNRCNDLRFNGSDLLVSLSDGLSVVDGSAGLVNLGQRAAWQNLSLSPAETRSWTLTVQAPAMLPTAPLHVAELYYLGRVAQRIDGIFVGAAAPAVEAAAAEPPAAAPVEPAAPAEPAPLPAVLPNTVGETGTGSGILLPAALLTAAMLLLSIVLQRLPRR